MTNRLSFAAALAASCILAGVSAAAGEGRADLGKAPAAESGAKATVTITLSGWGGNPTETAALRRTLTAFERANPRIKVNYAPISGDYDAVMLARFSARRPPDVFYVDSLDVPDYLPALQPLNSYIARSKFNLKPFYPRLLAAFRDRRGNIYGFPKDWSPLGLIANTSMLTRARVTVPRTWRQFTTALQRLQNSGVVAEGAPACLSIDWARILPFVYQNRGSWLNASRTASVINSGATRRAVEQYMTWLKQGLAKTPGQLGVGWCGEALGKQKAAIVFEGNWITDYMRDQFSSVRFAAYPMLTGTTRGNLGFTVSYSMGKNSPHKNEAWRLISFLTGKRGMTIWTQAVGYLPSRSDVKPKAGRAVYLREAPHSRPWQFVGGFDRVKEAADKELQAVFEGNQTVAQALAKIHSQTQDAIRR